MQTNSFAERTPQWDTQPVSRTLPLEHHNGALYVIIDSKAEAVIGFPMLCKHEAQAVRNFCDVADDPKSMLNRHPEDYSLFRLGWLTTKNTLVADHNLILSGSSYAATKKPETCQ